MAVLQLRNKSYRVLFCHGGRRHTYTIGAVGEREAENTLALVDQVLLRLEQGLLCVPDGVDIVTFVKNGGRAPEAPPPAPEQKVTFAQLRDAYVAAHSNGAMERNSLETVKLHLRHFAATLGERFAVRQLAQADLQRHLDRRAGHTAGGRRLSPVTLKKEMDTLRAVWNWGVHAGRVRGPFPSRGLVYPKADEKLPFMTWDEVERRIRLGGLGEGEAGGLWECLYLRKGEIDELLAHVQGHATQPWVYPLVCTAAHTGARRSELLRAEVADVDLGANVLLIRERKRSRQQRTTRHVTLSPFLKGVLREWLAAHPGGPHLFCQQAVVARSRKRSRTTGHRGGPERPTTARGRREGIREREGTPGGPVTKDEAHDHFKRSLAGSKWSVLRGFHVLRHSFISCLAAAGVDQRIIDDFVGHQTDEQRRRYRHLVPDLKQKAMNAVFG